MAVNIEIAFWLDRTNLSNQVTGITNNNLDDIKQMFTLVYA